MEIVLERPADTTAEAWAAQLALLCEMTGEQRVAIALRLTRLAREAARTGIQARHPDYTEAERRRAFFRMLHGDEATLCVWPALELLAP